MKSRIEFTLFFNNILLKTKTQHVELRTLSSFPHPPSLKTAPQLKKALKQIRNLNRHILFSVESISIMTILSIFLHLFPPPPPSSDGPQKKHHPNSSCWSYVRLTDVSQPCLALQTTKGLT